MRAVHAIGHAMASAWIPGLVLLGVLGVTRPCWAWSEDLHEALPRLGLAADDPWLSEEIEAATPEQLERFRRDFYELMLERGARFHLEYESFEDFDAWAFKRLLWLNPDAEVWGIDRSHAGERRTRLEWLTAGSRLPEDDRRNEDRLLYDVKRELVRDPWGRRVPADPAILDVGSMTGAWSKAHARYGLISDVRSSDPEVLERDPRRFSDPATAQTFAVDFAVIYTELALLAALSPEPGHDYLAALFLGNAWYHLGGLGSQIHTVQAGIYEFIFQAKLRSIGQELLSLGGLLFDRPGVREISAGILRNHHLVSERWFEGRFAAATAERLAELRRDDDDLVRRMAGALQSQSARAFSGELTRDLADTVVDLSSHEGPEVYQRIYDAGAPRMLEVGSSYEDGSDPALWMRCSEESAEVAASLEALEALQWRGFQRAATALRLHLRHIEGLLASVEVRGRPAQRRAVGQTLLVRLNALEIGRLQRVNTWRPKPPASGEIDWRWSLGLLGGVVVAVGFVSLVRRLCRLT